ncbi:MAG: VOC family protein [Candidatus Thorarchaeota archaeon]
MPKYPISYVWDYVYIHYKVTNLERAAQFYEETMGFEKAWDESDKGGWLEFSLPNRGTRLALTQTDNPVKNGSGTLVLFVDSVEESREYFKKNGIITTDIVDIPELMLSFTIEDTEGNPIQLVEYYP